MNCHDCSNVLYDYLDDELDTEARLKVESHLSSCALCQADWQEIQAAMALYRRRITAERPDIGFAGRVMTRLEDSKSISAISVPLAVLGSVSLILFITGLVAMMPLIYPIFRVFIDLTVYLLTVPAILLSLFPGIQITSIVLLTATLIAVTWAARRAISY